jgi:hypothetical protein
MCGKVGHVLDINNFVNLDREEEEEEEEEEEGSMPTNNMHKALKKQQVHVFRESQVKRIH